MFEGITEALASLLGTTPEEAGWILGFAVIVVLLIAFLLVLDKKELEVGYIAGGVGVAFVVLIGWWPIWSIIFIAFIVALALINPFASSSGGG